MVLWNFVTRETVFQFRWEVSKRLLVQLECFLVFWWITIHVLSTIKLSVNQTELVRVGFNESIRIAQYVYCERSFLKCIDLRSKSMTHVMYNSFYKYYGKTTIETEPMLTVLGDTDNFQTHKYFLRTNVESSLQLSILMNLCLLHTHRG